MGYRIDTFSNIPQAFFDIAEEHPDLVAYSQALATPSAGRSRRITTFREAKERVGKIHAYLKSVGFKKGDKAAIISSTRPEWVEADFAILCAGGVTVSVYQSLTAHDIGYILYDSGVQVVFAENEEQLEKLHKLMREPCAMPATEDRGACSAQIGFKRIITFEECAAEPQVTALDEILASVAPDYNYVSDLTRHDLASLVYTSGTTGPAKGVMQTHGNHLSNVRQARDAEIFGEKTSIFLLLPLAHSFAKLMSLIGFLWGVEIKYPAIANRQSSKPDPVQLARDMRECGAVAIPLVPRLLEKIRENLLKRCEQGGLGKIICLMLSNAVTIYEKRKVGQVPTLFQRALFQLLQPLRRKARRAIFGAQFEYAIIGGAKLPVSIAEFFGALEVTVFEGYGLTETSVATNVNRLGKHKVGTVGPVLSPDIEVLIAADGEVLFRGPNVAIGYINRSIATREAWDSEGWFHTGDLGALDADGYLSIIGRKKELIVTSNGKKIAPDHIEALLRASPLISQAMLWGEARQYLVAVLTLREDGIRAWAAGQGIVLEGSLEEDLQVRAALQEHVDSVNRDLASYESVKKFIIALEDFTIDNSLLTPTLKMRRKEVFKRYSARIEGLYEVARS